MQLEVRYQLTPIHSESTTSLATCSLCSATASTLRTRFTTRRVAQVGMAVAADLLRHAHDQVQRSRG